MAAKLKQYAQTLYNHKKKSIFAVVVGYYGVSWLRESNRDARIRSFYANAAKRYGDVPISPEVRPRRVTVLINPHANSGKASDNFNKNALPLLNLAGIDVTVIKAKDAEELESLAAVLEPSEADAIYVVGGDGTLSRVLTGLFGPKSLNRNGKTLPVGVFPGGVENRAIFGLLPDLFGSKSDVAKFCECAMAVIEEQKRTVYPVSCEISTTTDDGENTSEQVVTLDNIAAGWFEHCEHKKQKFWYYGGLKTRFTYLLEMLKNTPTPLQVEVDYEEYCSGCNRCKKATTRKSAPAVERRWWHALTGSPRYETKIDAGMKYEKDYSKIVNPNCGTRHQAHVQATDVQIRNLQVQDGSQLKLEAGGSNLGRLGVISEGWSRGSKPNREPSTSEFYDNHVVARAMNVSLDKKEGESGSDDDDQPTQTVAIGGEWKKLKAANSVLRIEPVQRPLHMPNNVAINEQRKHIDVDSSWLDKKSQKVQRVGLDASDKERAVVDLLTEKKQLSASAHGNIAAAETSDGQRAQVQRFGDKGGLAQVGGHKAQLRTTTDEEGQHALLKADGKYELDTIARGDLKTPENTNFVARNDRFDFKLDPKSHAEHQGEGTEEGKSGTYAYTIKQNGKKTDAELSSHDVGTDEFAQSLFGRRSDRYRCTAETPGVSQCYDAQGRSAGKVVADKNGDTIVYNDKDVPIGTGSVRKVSDRSYEAIISKNLFIARLKDARRGACCKELTGQECTAPIKLANPKFSHPSQRDGNGTVHLTWPDCFDMSIDVTLPPGVHINKLAMKLDVNIQPIGKLRCMDVATCGRECFYCDWCKNSRKLKLLDNTDGNLCRATDERTYRLTVKLCPPPEDKDFTLCSAFSKSIWQKDYWQKEGALDVWMKFYERGPNRPELEKEFFSQLDNPLLGKAFKLAIIGEWLAANSLDQGSYTPTNSELLEYWVSKRSPDRLLACEHAVIDYEIEGAKVKTNLLFEAATTAGSIPNIFKDKKCAAFEKLQERRFQEEVQDFKRDGGGGGILGGLGNLFSSRG